MSIWKSVFLFQKQHFIFEVYSNLTKDTVSQGY